MVRAKYCHWCGAKGTSVEYISRDLLLPDIIREKLPLNKPLSEAHTHGTDRPLMPLLPFVAM